MSNHRVRLDIAVAKRDVDEFTVLRQSSQLSPAERRRAELEYEFATLHLKRAEAIAQRLSVGSDQDPWRPVERLLRADALRLMGRVAEARPEVVTALERDPHR